MKFLHMIPPSTRTIGSFVKMVEDYFPADEHSFYSTKQIASNDDLFDNDRVQIMTGTDTSGKAGHVRDALSSADVIIWHGFFYNFKFMVFLYAYRRFLKKSIWVIWGLDIHNFKRKGRGFKTFIYNHVNNVVRKKIRYAVAVFPTDKDVYESKYSGKCFVAPYAINIEALSCIEAMRHADTRPNGEINIQVAHNAYPFNRHNEVLDTFKEFDDGRFRYYLPMSYGNGEEWPEHIRGYKSDVVEHARELYGQRVTFINKLLPKEVYNDFLWNMDIAVFPANRQNGIGNIIKLFYMDNKVFMSKGNPAYHYFKSRGLEVYEFEQLSQMSKDELLSKSSNPKARQWVLDNYHPLGAARLWDRVFSEFTVPSPILKELAGTEPAVVPNEDYSFPYKRNKMMLLPFMSNSVSIECKRIYVVGISPMALRWVGYFRAFIPNGIAAGIITDEKTTMGKGWVGDIDVVAGLRQAKALLDDGAIACTIDDPWERERLFNELYGNMADADIPSFVAGRSIGWQFVKTGRCTMISPNSTLSPLTSIGDCAIVDEASVGVGCQIGNFATLKPGCRLGDGVVVGDYATVEKEVFVPDGTIIESGEVFRGQRK